MTTVDDGVVQIPKVPIREETTASKMRKLAKSPKHTFRRRISDWSAERKTERVISKATKSILKMIKHEASWGRTEVMLYITCAPVDIKRGALSMRIVRHLHNQVLSKLKGLGFEIIAAPLNSSTSDILSAEDFQAVNRGPYYRWLDFEPTDLVWLWKITY